jgi:hypothetical protein
MRRIASYFAPVLVGMILSTAALAAIDTTPPIPACAKNCSPPPNWQGSGCYTDCERCCPANVNVNTHDDCDFNCNPI